MRFPFPNVDLAITVVSKIHVAQQWGRWGVHLRENKGVKSECKKVLRKFQRNSFCFWFARCPRHIQSVSNWIVDNLIWDIHVLVDWQLSKRVSADQCLQQTKTGGGKVKKKKQTNKREKREKKIKVEAEESLIINQNPLQDIRVQSGYNINTYSHIVIFVFWGGFV